MTVHRGPRGLHRMLAALGEPNRRRAYDLLRAAPRPLTRADVATELGIGLRLAAFHLDKLVEEGLLSAHYARPPGRTGGPGAGRPAKWYVAEPARFDVTVPPRRYDIAARILLATLPDEIEEELLSRAHQYGQALATQHPLTSLDDLLVDLGYEPHAGPDTAIELTNCPFNELAEQARQKTCTMNHAFLQGVTSVNDQSHEALLDPRPGLCCVRLTSKNAGPTTSTTA